MSAPTLDAVTLLSGLLRDAVRLAHAGVASPADIDVALRLGAGHPAGPFAVLAGLPPEYRQATGLPEVDAPGEPDPPGRTASAWTGPVGVAGTGHMATGIVEAIARSGRPVRVLARSTASGRRVREGVTRSLDRALSRGRIDAEARDAVLARLTVTTEPADLAGVDVVIEAVAEDLAVKSGVVAALDAVLPTDLPIATNTSSFRVADLRPSAGPQRPVLALHFFNPAPVMNLVEVVVPADVPGGDTLSATANAWVRALGKTPVRCADRRGFVVNRLLIPYLNDAVRRHESGVSAADVDEMMRAGAGHPMGPLALIDLIGLDVTVAALDSLAAVETDPRLTPAPLLRDLVAAGRLGRKSGAGFHPYPESGR